MYVKEQYIIKANQSDLTYKSNNEDVAIVSRNGMITAVGNVEAVISVVNENSDVVYFKVKMGSLQNDDIDGDGKLTVADVVLLQKWILAEPYVKLANWKVADLCEDDRLDAFDMIEMRKLLIQNK